MFVDCYSQYTILVPSSNHTANTVSEALLRHVIPYFGTPRRLLSDCGREFVSEIWTKLLRSLGIQRVLSSPYHPEGNATNERSHRTLNNMLRARLLEGSSSKAWVDKVPGIMLTLNAMPHEPHGFSVSMIATGREATLPPDVHLDAHASPAVDDPSDYVEAITQRLQLTHQQMTSPSPPSVANPYQVGSLIYAMTTPLEHASKLSPCWKGPYCVCQIPNEYQLVYEDGEVQRTIHINHAKPVKFTAPDLPEPVPIPKAPRPPLGYLPAGLARPRPPPPAAASPAGDSSSSSASAPTAPQPATPAKSAMQPPATSPANQRPEPAPHPRRSHRLNPEPDRACAIKSPPGNPPHRSAKASRMARTYPLTVPYTQCPDSRVNPLSFASLRLVDLRNGQSQYLSTIKQLVDALPKTEDPSSRFALQGHIARPGQKRLRHSMRAAIWWLLPSDGTFHCSSDSLQYFLTRQGWRVVLRGGDVTLPPLKKYLNWVYDPTPPPSRYHGDLTSPAPSGDHGFSSRNKENTPPQDAPRKIPRKLRLRRRKERQPGSTTNQNSPSWKAGSGTQCAPTANSNSTFQETGSATRPGSTANHNSTFQEAGSATRPRSTANDNSPLAGNRPRISGSMKSTPVEHPRTFLRPQHPQHPRIWTNHNSGRRSDPDHPEFRGVYKPAQPSIQQDYTNRSRRDSFSESGLSSPALQRSHRDSFSGSPLGQSNKKLSLTDPKREERITGGFRPVLVLPHPRAACPDTRLELDAAPPEAAAISRAEWPPTVLDIPKTGWLETTRCPEPSHRRGSCSPRHHSCKRPRNRSSALYQPKKRPPHPGHWCE